MYRLQHIKLSDFSMNTFNIHNSPKVQEHEQKLFNFNPDFNIDNMSVDQCIIREAGKEIVKL